MGELDTNLLVLRVSEVDDTAERFNLTVFPKTAVFRRDAAFWEDGSGFDE